MLDARLEDSFGKFDGMIIGEREHAQSDADKAGSSVMGTGGSKDGESGASGEGQGAGRQGSGPVVVASAGDSSSGNGTLPVGTGSRQGDYTFKNQQSFPAPADIPSGNDDDVVAKQLREAAMHEPDPELREKLWNEYRKYTGLAVPAETDTQQ